MVLTAEEFEKRVRENASEEGARQSFRFFPNQDENDYFIGVKMGVLFQLGKEFIDMPVGEIEKLLESPVHELKAGGMSVMDKCARRKKTTEARRKDLYELYLRRPDRINSWDMVDLGAQYVVGRYLEDKSREPLYELANSSDPWERRTALVATLYYRHQNDLKDMLAISEILVHDEHLYVQKAVGWVLRVVGDLDRTALTTFLDVHAGTMPRQALRNAIEHLDADERKRYLAMGKS